MFVFFHDELLVQHFAAEKVGGQRSTLVASVRAQLALAPTRGADETGVPWISALNLASRRPVVASPQAGLLPATRTRFLSHLF